MFSLVRWMFLLVVLAGLTAFLVSFHFRGQTPAEGLCKLAQSYECFQLAERGGALVDEAQRRLAGGPPPAPHAARRETSENPRISRAPQAPAGEPLDRHTPGERKALSDLLLQHGSR